MLCILIPLQACTGGPPIPERPPRGLDYPRKAEALGETRERLEEAYNRLCSPPLSDLDFVLADVELDITRRFTEYSGDISGRMLGALQVAGPLLGRRSPMVEQLAAAFPRLQNSDGHFGCEQDLEKLDQRRDMPILWGNGRLLLAMAERLREQQDPDLLAAAKRLGEYVISTRRYYGRKENFEQVGGTFASGFTTCYPSLVDGLAALAGVTDDRRFAEEARFIARLSLLDDTFKHRHSHGRLSAFRGMLDLDRSQEEPEFVPVVAEKIRMITGGLILPSGGITEQFDRHDTRDEGCSVGDWIRVNVFLWEATGDLRFLDTAEHALRNHFHGTQQVNGGFGHTYLGPLQHGGEAYHGARIRERSTESYWCCSMHGAQVLADIARWSILSAGGDIMVTWLGEAKSEVTLNRRTVTVTAQRESPSRWNLSFHAADGDRVWLRVPDWAGGITVNGRACEVKNGWTSMIANGTTSWKVRFPDPIHLRSPYGDKVAPGEPVRVFAAGELYALPESELTQGLLGSEDVPKVLLGSRLPDQRRIPVVVVAEDQRTQRASLVPVATRPWGGSRLLLDVQRIDPGLFKQQREAALPPPAQGTPVELTVCCDGLAEVYLNGRAITRARHWVETATVQTFSHREENILALHVFSEKPRPAVIAMVRAGGSLHVSGKGAWTAVPCEENINDGWLEQPGQGLEKVVKIADLGGFGAPPWDHMSAAYAGSGARWVWPGQDGQSGKRWWLLRTTFRIPPGQSNDPHGSGTKPRLP